MASKTLHIVPGLSRTPLLFIPRYLTNIIFENIFQQQNLENRKSENLKFQNFQLTNKCPVFYAAGVADRDFENYKESEGLVEVLGNEKMRGDLLAYQNFLK